MADYQSPWDAVAAGFGVPINGSPSYFNDAFFLTVSFTYVPLADLTEAFVSYSRSAV